MKAREPSPANATPEGGSAAPPARGALADWSLPRLLLALARGRFTGALRLGRGQILKRVLYREGVPTIVDSNLPSEGLGEHLRSTGRLSADDRARVVEMARSRGCREETALLALELLEPEDVLRALRELARRRLLDCFAWPDGLFAVDSRVRPAADAAALGWDPLPLIQEGIAVHWEPARIRSDLARRAGRFAEPSARLDAVMARLHCDDDVRTLVAALDGRTPFGDLLARVRLPSTLATAWLLEACGALRFRDRPALAPIAGSTAGAGAPAIEIVVGGAARREAKPAAAPAGREAIPPARDAGEAERLRGEIADAYAALAERDHYATLGVARDAPAAALKRAYFQAAKRFHPDTLARMGLLELKDQARAVFAQIAKAHAVLSDPSRRKDYDASLAAGGSENDGARLVQAETLYRKAQILLRAGNFTGALEFLRPAAELVPDDPAYRLALGWSLYRGRPSDPKGARAELERATALAPRDAVAHHRLGVVLRALGEEDAAAAALAHARQLDPSVGAA